MSKSSSDKAWLSFGNLLLFAFCCLAVAMIPGIVYLVGDIITPLHEACNSLGDWINGLTPVVKVIGGLVLAGYAYFVVVQRRYEA